MQSGLSRTPSPAGQDSLALRPGAAAREPELVEPEELHDLGEGAVDGEAHASPALTSKNVSLFGMGITCSQPVFP